MNEKHRTNARWNLFCECDAEKVQDAHFNDAGAKQSGHPPIKMLSENLAVWSVQIVVWCLALEVGWQYSWQVSVVCWCLCVCVCVCVDVCLCVCVCVVISKIRICQRDEKYGRERCHFDPTCDVLNTPGMYRGLYITSTDGVTGAATQPRPSPSIAWWREAWTEEALDDPPWKDERGPYLQSDKHWNCLEDSVGGNCWEMGVERIWAFPSFLFCLLHVCCQWCNCYIHFRFRQDSHANTSKKQQQQHQQ